MLFKPVFSALALGALAVRAITVEAPTDDTIWQANGGAQTVSWKAVSTDQKSFVVQLVNQAGFLTDSPVALIANQSTGASDTVNSVTVTFPSGPWPVGTAFQINLMSSDKNNAAILAQSQQFNITSGGTNSGNVPTTILTTATTTSGTQTGVVTSTIPAVTAGRNGQSSSAPANGDASGGIPNAVSSSTGAADTNFGTPGAFVSLLIGAAALIGVTI